MRKRLKRKRRSCPLCKPQKTGRACRWKPREEAALRAFERERAAGRIIEAEAGGEGARC